MNSKSRIEKITGEKAVYDLFWTGDSSPFSPGKKFDLGMISYLECMNQLGEFQKNKNNNFKIPFK